MAGLCQEIFCQINEEHIVRAAQSGIRCNYEQRSVLFFAFFKKGVREGGVLLLAGLPRYIGFTTNSDGPIAPSGRSKIFPLVTAKGSGNSSGDQEP